MSNCCQSSSKKKKRKNCGKLKRYNLVSVSTEFVAGKVTMSFMGSQQEGLNGVVAFTVIG